MLRKFHQNMRSIFFSVLVTEHWNREGVESSPLEIFKNYLDAILCNVQQADPT